MSETDHYQCECCRVEFWGVGLDWCSICGGDLAVVDNSDFAEEASEPREWETQPWLHE